MTGTDIRDDALGKALDAAVRDLHPLPNVGLWTRAVPRSPQRILPAAAVAAVFVGLAVVAATLVGERAPSVGDMIRYPSGWNTHDREFGRISVVTPDEWTVFDDELGIVMDSDIQVLLGVSSDGEASICGRRPFFGSGAAVRPDSIAISVVEWTGGGWGVSVPPSFAPRPERLLLSEAIDTERATCRSGAQQLIRTFRFRDAGRLFIVKVGARHALDPETTRDIELVINSLRVEPLDDGWWLPESSSRHMDQVDGVAVDVPSGWQVADENLTPWLAQPTEILSLGTFPMPVSEDPDDELRVFDAPVAPRALAAMGPQDAFVSVQEAGSPGADDRPASFRMPDGRLCCSGNTGAYPFTWWWVPFNDQGRGFYLFVAIGNEASPDVVDQAWSVADSLRFGPAAQAPSAP